MTATDRPATRGARSPLRKYSLTAGILYLITFISIPTLALYGPVKGAGFITSATAATGALWGGVLEVIVALAGIGTALALFPVVKRKPRAGLCRHPHT